MGDPFVGTGSIFCRYRDHILSWEAFLSPLGLPFVVIEECFVGQSATIGAFGSTLCRSGMAFCRSWECVLSVTNLPKTSEITATEV